MLEPQFALAKQMLAGGNLAAVDIVCRDVLDAYPENTQALNYLGIIAAQVGELEKARAYFTRAGDAGAQVNLNMLQRIAPRPKPPEPRYLLIKAWGYGFWSDVTQVLGSLFLAEVTGRIPVVHWGAASLFGDGTGDAFTRYFQPVSAVGLDHLCRMSGAQLFPPKWTGENLRQDDVAKWTGPGSRAGAVYFLNRPEMIGVSDFFIGPQHVLPWSNTTRALDAEFRRLAQTWLRPQPDIIQAAERFIADRLGHAPYVAVHLRGSDKIIEDKNMAAHNDAVIAALDDIDPAWPVFLLTDDVKILADMQARFGDRIVATDCQRTDAGLGLHYRPETDRIKAGREIMIDTYIALGARRFIGNAKSNVAAMIGVLKDWPDGSCTLIGPSMFADRQLPLYIMQF